MFCSRQTWSNQVAYLSQFGNRVDRAHLGKARIASRILKQPVHEAYKLPSRPARMPNATYKKYADRFARYDAILEPAK
jgi:hypothetical protein